MDHDDVLEQIELAAVEPGGLDAADGRRHADGGRSRGPSGRLRALRRGAAAAVAAQRRCCATSSERRHRPTCASGRSPMSATYGRPRGDAASAEVAALPRFPRQARRPRRSGRPRRRASRLARRCGGRHRPRRRFGRVHGGPRRRRSLRRRGDRPRGRQQGDARHQRGPRRRVASCSHRRAARSTSGTLLYSPSTTRLVVVASDLDTAAER